VKKVIILMFTGVLLVGCSSDESTKNNSNQNMYANSRTNIEDCEKDQTCKTENCFRCNLKIGNNLTPINSDSPYGTATRSVETTDSNGNTYNSGTRSSETTDSNGNTYSNSNKTSYEDTRYGNIAKTAREKQTKATRERTKRNQRMAISHRDIAPQRSK
jgi:hypothetical protein